MADTSYTLRPLSDRLVVRPIEQADVRESGLFLPETAKERPQEAIVVAVGPGRRYADGTLVPVAVNVGDRIVYTKFAETEIQVDGVKHCIVFERDVVSVVESAA